MPVVEHMLGQLGEARFFSKLDANSGFHQIPLSPDCQHLTTFITPFGRYKYCRMPFGISLAPEYFQKVMSIILQGMDGVMCYLDDILIFASDSKTHDRILRLVLRKLKEANVTLNKAKCVFGVPRINFLGHILDEDGIRPDPAKIEAVAKMPAPTDVHGVRRFLGMVNHLGRFVENLSEIVAPLSQLLVKSQDFVWDCSQERAFRKLKELLTTQPILAAYDVRKPTMVSSDASSYGLGAVLKQEGKNGIWRPVAYSSRTMTPIEKRYAQIEKEALAITWACERFQDFLLGKRFRIETDHKPLIPLFSTERIEFADPKTATFSNAYDEGGENERQTSAHINAVLSSITDKDEMLTKIFEAQQEDTTLKAVVNYLEQGWPDKKKMSQALLSYWHVKDELGVQNGLLMRSCRLVIPASMKLEILDKLHAGHFGITKTRLRARETVWWPGISEEIAETVRKCSVCIQEAVSKHEPLIPTNFPTRPWQKIGMDLFKFENKWYLVVIDYYSRFPEMIQLDRLTASVVVRSCKSIFARHGIPETVVSDNGTQFGAAREFADFARQYGFTHVTSSPRFPQSNGMAEAGVKIAKLILKKNQDPSLGLLEYRSTPLENGYSPAELLMGRKLRTTLPIAPENLNPKLVDSQTLKRKEGRRRKDMKSRYDRRCGATDMDTVWITDMRTWGIVKQKASTPRSYMVDTPVGTLRRNRFHLRKGVTVQYPADPSTPTFSEEDLAENEKTPVVDYPSNDSEDGQIRTRSERHILGGNPSAGEGLICICCPRAYAGKQKEQVEVNSKSQRHCNPLQVGSGLGCDTDTVQLTPTDGQLMAAANQRLENAGTFVAKLRANTREMKETVYVVHHLEQPLLGVGACEDLQLVKRIDLVINGTTDVNPEREFPKLFEGLGLLEQPYHIKLKEGAKPFSIPVPRRVPLPLMPKLKEQLDAMVAQEVIEPVDEPTEWCAPIVLAGKPNGKIRICVDLSRLNLSVERELHPLPVLEHELAQLNGAKIFSRLDTNSGFWQIKLSEESQTLTTFITPFGRYKFKRLPFGISSAPEHFQKRMSAILRGVNGVICHMDDILIFAKRKEEHDETLREVLRRLKNSGITLNKEKCQFGVNNVTFLGHYIDEHGIKADEKKVKAIAEMKPPTDVHGVQRFMGMVNFLGRFVPNLAEITKPLNDLRKKDKTMVSADASSYGLGAVLKQEHEANEWRPVAFASRTLTKTEQGYAQIEKEALAITWACERFKDFVVGKPFLIETDHKPLVPIFTTKDLNDLTPRLQRYRMRMLQFLFHIFHTPGKDLITADALSRQPLPGHLPEDEELQEEVEHFVRSIVLHQSTTDDRLAKIALNQKLEPTLQNVAFYSKNGWPAKCQLSPLERSFYDVRDEIGEENGLLMRGLRVIIPFNMRKNVLNRIHAGHQGITKCRARAKDHVWWPGIGQEIQDMVKTCEKCIENQPLKHEPLIPNDFPERPWQKVGMDLFHYEGSEYLVVVDYLSRFIEVVQLTKLSSEAVVDHCKAIFARHGIPDIVISDNGPQFRPSTTSDFTKFASEVGFRHITSSPKHPQSNGQAEAAVKIVKNLMKKNKDPVLALMEYRATPLANGLSTAELLFGRKIRTMVPCTSSSLTPKTVDQSKLRGEEEQRKMAQKTAFDRRHAATKKAELIAGEKVWVKDLRAWGSVLEKASAPRSYIVETPVGTYRRNSLLLASSQQQVDPSETSPDSELPAETEETPGNELPAEELQQMPANAPEIKQLSPSPGKVSRPDPGPLLAYLDISVRPGEGVDTGKELSIVSMEISAKMVQHLWKRWSTDFIHSLQQQNKWKTKESNMLAGSLGFIKEGHVPPAKWLMGRVVEVHPGKDGVVRVVSLRTMAGVIKRPLVKLALLQGPPVSFDGAHQLGEDVHYRLIRLLHAF
ncbi:K02A2.6-like, partial [Cordylochernes scorpioides]